MVNTRQFSGSTYMQDMTKSHTFSAKNQGSTYTPIRLIRREIRYLIATLYKTYTFSSSSASLTLFRLVCFSITLVLWESPLL